MLKSKIEKQEKLVIDYFYQEIDFTDDSYAFVELYGTGATQAYAAELIQKIYAKPVKSFFYVMEGIHFYPHNINFTYYPHKAAAASVLELLCRALHGQTVGYRRDENGHIAPVFDEEGEELRDYGYDVYLDGVRAFAKYYTKIVQNYCLQAESMKVCAPYYNYITIMPESKILEYFGDMPFENSGFKRKQSVFAPVLSQRELKEIYLLNPPENLNKVYKAPFLFYSYLRASESDKKIIAYYQNNYDSKWGKRERELYETSQQQKNGQMRKHCCWGEKVVLYGAGIRGKAHYRKLSLLQNVTVVLWADRNYEKYRENGLPVYPPKDILNYEYDSVLIAVANKELVKEIEEELINIGVEKDDMIWLPSL